MHKFPLFRSFYNFSNFALKTPPPMNYIKAPFYIKKLNPQAFGLKKGSERAAGFDICAAEDCLVPAQGKCLVKTGLAFAVPTGNYARIAPRSGLAWKNFIDVGAGVIDEDYRGEGILLIFNEKNPFFSN